MRSTARFIRLLATAATAVALTLGVTTVAASPSTAAPMPAGGSSAVLDINNQSGLFLTLARYPDTSVGGGSSLDFRWIDPPPRTLNPGQRAIVRAWTSNPVTMSVEVTYSAGLRFGVRTYRSSLQHFFYSTNLADTGASSGGSVYGDITQFGPAMRARYVLD